MGKALKIFNKNTGLDKFEICKVLLLLGHIYEHLGDPHRAKGVFEKCFVIRNSVFGIKHAETMKKTKYLLVTHLKLGNLEIARVLSFQKMY